MTPTALVTGAASGIGLATVQALRAAGWQVEGLDRQDPPEMAGAHHLVDVCDEPSLVGAVHGILAERGGLDAVVCCAGVSGSSAGDGPIADSTAAAFDAVVSVNLRGALITVSAAWDALSHTGGSVVLVSSVLGLTGGGGPFTSTAYIVSKGGLIALTRTLAAQGRAAGVRANCVAPGLVDTPLAGRARGDARIAAYVRDRQPLAGGPLAPGSVAAAITFLCSPDAHGITGQILSIDAGWGLDPE